MNQLAPIIVFCYNRPRHVEQTLLALSKNELADQSVLYIYCDGPKDNASNDQIEKITEVRRIVRKQKWCKEVHIFESDKNKGLANSIIGGVTDVINQYGKVIVLEDDIVTSVGFLRYMNDALDIYKDEDKVMHISAYMYPHKKKLPETFFFTVPYPGGGWATWQRAWKHFRDDADYFYGYFEKHKQWDKFNKLGGKYLQKQLKANVDGALKTWFIKWHATLLLLDGLTLYPNHSLTNNIGFDETGTHCSPMTKFDIENPAVSINVEKIGLVQSKKATKIIIRFYQGRFYPVRNFFIKFTPDRVKLLIKNMLKIN